MIQANELRIGNWVDTDHGYGVVTELKRKAPEGFSVGVTVAPLQNFVYANPNPRPIPLTPEILEKWCGFVRNGITSSNGSKLSIHHKEPLYPNGRVYFNSWCIMNKIPEYLHQFQNLYFALTGEELPVNL